MDGFATTLPYLGTLACIGYLDPASGSMLLQILLGLIAGAAVALKLGWRHIAACLPLGFWRKKAGPEVLSSGRSGSPDTEKKAAETPVRRAA
jgi:hypothetical protein